LKQLLAPLGIYDLEEGIGAQEIKVLGAQFDEIFSALEEIGREAFAVTAQDYGLKSFEAILPYTPAYITAEDERRAIMALLRIRGGCFSLEMIQNTLGGCGIAASVAQSEKALTVRVGFPMNRGIPEGFDLLKTRIEEILPCHLAAEYSFIYSTWQELMSPPLSWSLIETAELSWRELEIYE